MGLYREGPPREFLVKIRKKFNINYFVETGTYHATTATWASYIFKKVYTIEAFKSLYDEISSKYKSYSNITFILGNSRDKLRIILSEINEPVIFWLDAHYSGDGTYGEIEQCPIIEEILTINKFNHDCIILIDDARLFLSPSSIRLSINEWPNITEVINLLNKIPGRYIIILEDVIFCVPERMKSFTAKYSQELNSINSFLNSDGLSFIKKLIKFIIRKLKGI